MPAMEMAAAVAATTTPTRTERRARRVWNTWGSPLVMRPLENGGRLCLRQDACHLRRCRRSTTQPFGPIDPSDPQHPRRRYAHSAHAVTDRSRLPRTATKAAREVGM